MHMTLVATQIDGVSKKQVRPSFRSTRSRWCAFLRPLSNPYSIGVTLVSAVCAHACVSWWLASQRILRRTQLRTRDVYSIDVRAYARTQACDIVDHAVAYRAHGRGLAQEGSRHGALNDSQAS